MTSTAMIFFMIGATVLWGGLAVTSFVFSRHQKAVED